MEANSADASVIDQRLNTPLSDSIERLFEVVEAFDDAEGIVRRC